MAKILHFAGYLLVATLAGCALMIALMELPSAAQPADGIEAPDQIAVMTLHAQGVQIYECKSGVSGPLAWQFREPSATLIENGLTVGQHYAGPSWQLSDGSTIVGKAVGRAAGKSARDIPHLKLEVVSRRGSGRLSEVSTIQRLDTRGGIAEGACERAGDLMSVPYSADYVFLRRIH